MEGKNDMLADDEKVQRYLAEVERFLRVVCDDDEYPWFVSDQATIFDVSTTSEVEIMERIAAGFGYNVTVDELNLPLWQLAMKASGGRSEPK